MEDQVFNPEDLKHMEKRGISVKEVMSQLKIFEKASTYVRLVRPCTVNDGIIQIKDDEKEELLSYHKEVMDEGRCIKFVPASGAATRMFKILLWYLNNFSSFKRKDIVERVEQGDKNFKELLKFLDNISKFAFYDDLEAVLRRDGYDINELLDKEEYDIILKYLLTSVGLNYANLPKALLKFHKYNGDSRTALEEHLIEAINYVKDGENRCKLHFTVSPQYMENFKSHIQEVSPKYESRYGVTFEIDFSIQKPSTDTIAVDLENKPFRLPDGSILFRPGGHGALIENLNDLEGDIIFIKNIDNVVPDRVKDEVVLWKKLLCGYLVRLQNKIYSYLQMLSSSKGSEEFIEEVIRFIQKELDVSLPPHKISLEEKRDFVYSILDRPIRVCGVVRNVKEPGGGPFWVSKDGELSKQIIESAQVDFGDETQKKIWNSSTHFNPVDIVCGVRDFRGKPFNLKEYVDKDAVFITQKSKDGQELKALELPGLWNGSMAYWNTIFVEVPLITFNPVKTVNDLLRKEHQL